MNLTKIFSYLYIMTFSTMFLFLSASEWRETLQFLSFGAEKQAVIVANLNEGLMDFPDAEVEPSHILAKVLTGEMNQVKAISKVPLYRPRVGDQVSVLVIGKRNYVKINNWLSLYFKGTFYIMLAVLSVMAGLWALRSKEESVSDEATIESNVSETAVRPNVMAQTLTADFITSDLAATEAQASPLAVPQITMSQLNASQLTVPQLSAVEGTPGSAATA